MEKMNINPKEKLFISKKANLILPTHRLLDAAYEAAAGKGKIGSTLKGIGPTYTDKISRHGLRVGDILAPDFKERFEKLKARHIQLLSDLHFECDPDKDEAEWMSAIEFLEGIQPDRLRVFREQVAGRQADARQKGRRAQCLTSTTVPIRS